MNALIVFIPGEPCAEIPLVLSENPECKSVDIFKSPQSVAFPSLEIFTKSIMLERLGEPPATKNPLSTCAGVVDPFKPPWPLLALSGECNPSVKSPKSVALPVDAIVTKSITFCLDGVKPAPNTALVELDTPATKFLATVRSPKSVALPADAVVINCITFVYVEPSGE